MSQEQYFTGNERATAITYFEGKTIVSYHRTNVVIVDPVAEEVTFNTGGWETATTRRRFNQACNKFGLPYHAYIRDFSMHIACDHCDKTWELYPVTLVTLPLAGHCEGAQNEHE